MREAWGHASSQWLYVDRYIDIDIDVDVDVDGGGDRDGEKGEGDANSLVNHRMDVHLFREQYTIIK